MVSEHWSSFLDQISVAPISIFLLNLLIANWQCAYFLINFTNQNTDARDFTFLGWMHQLGMNSRKVILPQFPTVCNFSFSNTSQKRPIVFTHAAFSLHWWCINSAVVLISTNTPSGTLVCILKLQFACFQYEFYDSSHDF